MHNTFIPSPQQSDIFSLVAAPACPNLQINAVAGSGKSTTLRHLLEHIPKRHASTGLSPSVLFLAFNKAIAEDLKARVPAGTECCTFNALGFRALRSFGVIDKSVKVDAGKCMKYIWNALDRNDPDVSSINRLVGLAKSVPDEPDWQAFITQHDLDLENPAQAVRVAAAVLERSNSDLSLIDFNDQLYLPVIRNVPFTKYDYILVDEAQDTNPIQIEIIDRLRKPHSVVISVGDRKQAIYGFRGADATAMDVMARRFRMQEMPLSVSYRCSKAVVLEAQKYYANN